MLLHSVKLTIYYVYLNNRYSSKVLTFKFDLWVNGNFMLKVCYLSWAIKRVTVLLKQWVQLTTTTILMYRIYLSKYFLLKARILSKKRFSVILNYIDYIAMCSNSSI